MKIFSNPIYEYFIKDHLGNTRAVVAIVEDGMDTLQTVDYYPFGMIMGGRDKQPGKEDNKYLFGCKELVNDFGSFGGTATGRGTMTRLWRVGTWLIRWQTNIINCPHIVIVLIIQ